jgi:branched-chain amino acid transport system substrate-binding protein
MTVPTVLLATCIVAAGACGGDDDSDTSAAGNGNGNGNGGSGGELELAEPLEIAGLVEVSGESDAASDLFNNGFELAIDEINADGGIGGQQIEYTREPLSIFDPAKAQSQFLSVLDSDPDVIVGLPSNTQFGPLKSQIDRTQIPVIAIAPLSDAARFGGDEGSEYLWTMMPASVSSASLAATFLGEELGAESIGLMGTNEQFGNTGVAAAEAALDELGLTAAATRQHAPDASDLTADILEMQEADVDAIFDWDFPNPLGALLNQLQQNGLSVPVISGESTPIVVDNELATGDAISNLYSIGGCFPSAEDATPQLKEFRQKYLDAYDSEPNGGATHSYDAIYVIKAAVEAAGSADPAAINEALADLKVTEGVACQPEYAADGSHGLAHNMTIVSYEPDGTRSAAKSYEIDPLPAVDG